jgi:thiol-disulfide isomerase/thioredoxin
MHTMNRIPIFVVFVFALLAATGCRQLTLTPGTTDTLVGEPAPAFSSRKLNASDHLAIDDLRGKVVLVDFWAVFCGPCRDSMPHLQDFFQRYPAEDLAIVSVNLDPPDSGREAMVTDYLRASGFTFDVVLDNGRVAGLYGANRIPRMVLIDRAGTVRRVFQGRTDVRIIEGAIQALLSDADSPG